MKELRVNKEYVKAIVILLLIACIPLVIRDNNYRTVSCQAMTYAIVALGLNFIVGLSGIMTLGTAAILGLGAYSTALLTTKLGVSPWLSLIVAALIGWLIGKGLGYPSLRLSGVYLSLVTIGFNTIVQNLLTNLQFTGSGTGVRGIPNFSLFGVPMESTLQKFYFIYAFLVVFIVIAHRIVHSKWGRAFATISNNGDALETCGIDMASIKVTAFTLSSVFAALAGSLYAGLYNYVAPTTFNTGLSTSFVVMIIVGGLGNFWGCIFGAFIIAFVPQLMRPLGDWYRLIYASSMTILILLFPNGIVKDLRRRIGGLFKKAAKKGGEPA